MSNPPVTVYQPSSQTPTRPRRMDNVRDTIGYDEALQRLLALAPTLPAESCALMHALGRILAADMVSPMSLPSFDHAAMDGYALAVRGGAHSGSEYAVKGSRAAGDGQSHFEDGACEIMTGARLPSDFDAVVAVEQTELLASHPDDTPARVRLLQAVEAGQNVRYAGSDIAVGASVARAGSRIDSALIMLLAALGCGQVDVVRRPRVAIICTGKELQADTSRPLDDDRIYNSNGPFLMAALASAGAEVRSCHTVDDTAVSYADALQEISREGVDLIISTGAVSMGRYDFIPTLLRQLQADIVFHGVAMRPGKPLLCARLAGGTLVLGMPGTPMAVAVAMRFFVAPLLRAMQGQQAETKLVAVLDAAQKPKAGLRHFMRGQLHLDEKGCLHATPMPQQQPYRIHAFSQANAWVILPEQAGDCEVGMRVEIASLEAGVPVQADCAQAGANLGGQS
ncbi:molybdopterin molybdotransferase MoeA [Dyella sp. 20L07]|uniref:molybdopterin molybdotransferase MoeA n=1 Tax=Dyella sp. 20L07 TaxID=3384240 RepID=UPI003D297F6D